jgi:hypothetical protein
MTDAPKRFEITSDLLALAAAANKQLAGLAKVHIYIRNDPDRARYCVLMENGPKRATSESELPLNNDENDLAEVVAMATKWASAPKPVHSRYQPFEM